MAATLQEPPPAPPAAAVAALAARLAAAGIAAAPGARLAGYTTFGLGGPAPLLATCRTQEQVVAAVAACRAAGMPWLLIGGGSNLLVSDRGVDRVVLRFVSTMPDVRRDGDRLEVGGGTILDHLAVWAGREGFGGLVNASGVPGTVGGAVVGNAGAWGWQLADCLVAARLLAPDGSVRLASRADIGFAYRDSGLKRSGEVVLAAILAPPPGDPAALAAQRRDILAQRAEKHPDLRRTPCAGSFFRNLEPTSAAARRQAAGHFLEQAGAKTMRRGGAAVFPKHANIPIAAAPDCRAQDVLDLTRAMARAVREQFGIDLVREVRVLGAFDWGDEPPAPDLS